MRKLAALVTPTCGQESSIAAARRTLTGIQHCCCAPHENDTVRSVLVSACEGTCLVLCLHGGPLGPISCLAAEGIQTSRCRSAQHREAPGAKGQDTHTRVHKRCICRTVAHWRSYARDLLLALGGPALGGSGRGSCLWGPRPNAGSPRPHGQWWRRVHRPPEVPPCRDQRARQQACLPFVTATGKLASQPASWPAGQVAR